MGSLGPLPVPPNTDQLHHAPARATGAKLWPPPQWQCLCRKCGAEGRGAGCGPAATVHSLLWPWARDLALSSHLHVGNTSYPRNGAVCVTSSETAQSYCDTPQGVTAYAQGRTLPLRGHELGEAGPGVLTCAHLTPQFSDGAFLGVTTLKNVHLENNRLNQLPSNFPFDNLETLTLTNNPWKCTCQLQGLRR